MATIIDVIIILLLIGSITYGYLVSRKVRLLMTILRNLEPLVEEFSSAVDKSHDSVNQMRESIEVAEQVKQPDPAAETPLAAQSTFASRRATPAPAETSGMRVIRDKKEMVQAFFDTSSPAKV